MFARRPLPPWLSRPRADYKARGANALRSYDYWLQIYWATPPWLSKSHRAQMRAIYKERPEGMHVDHEVPLKGDGVCGLNVPWNLRYLPAGANMSKGAQWWPDMWAPQQQDLFDPFRYQPFELAAEYLNIPRFLRHNPD